MKIGVPKEIKNHEYRVGLTPSSVLELTSRGHSVYVETQAGAGINAQDHEYIESGATIVDSAEEVFATADMIVKVKEPQPVECQMLRPQQILFTFLHLAPDPVQTKGLIESGATCIAYETVTSPQGGLPLLAPMSKVAGRLSIQAGATCLEQHNGGLGTLLGGVPGVPPAKVVIIGAGMVGTHAAHIAVGMGANVIILDNNNQALEAHWRQFGNSTQTVFSSRHALEQHVTNADLVIGGVLVPGAAAPKLVTKAMVNNMKSGAVIVDVAIDQGGCFETSKPTTHADPTFIAGNNVVHYCVANMPGGVPRTSTYALNNTTLRHTLALADKGVKQALRDDPHLLNGLNVIDGKITQKEVADALGYEFYDPEKTIND